LGRGWASRSAHSIERLPMQGFYLMAVAAERERAGRAGEKQTVTRSEENRSRATRMANRLRGIPIPR
jgi:hypothetical protein